MGDVRKLKLEQKAFLLMGILGYEKWNCENCGGVGYIKDEIYADMVCACGNKELVGVYLIQSEIEDDDEIDQYNEYKKELQAEIALESSTGEGQ